MKKVTREELMKMNADDLFRTFQTSEEICSFMESRPHRLSSFHIGKFKADDELSDHIDSLLNSKCQYYIDEINKGFETKADLTELVTKLKSEPIMARLYTWSRTTVTTDLQFAKYVHKHLALMILEIFKGDPNQEVPAILRAKTTA